jgi:OmpA-OmpF porin, OOP family
VVESSSTSWLPWLLVPLVALLGWWWFANQAPVGTINPRISVVNDDGRIICSASVRDDATKQAILQAVRASFGGNTSCDIAVDANVKALSWLPNAAGVFAALNRPGTEFTLDGNSVQLGGWLTAAERNASLNNLRGLLGTDYNLAENADKESGVIAESKAKAMAALAALTGTFSPEAFSSAMNLAVINFASGSSVIPADSTDLIAQAAAVLKTAPAGTVIEIGGHTDSTGDPASNMALSEARANAVRAALIASGVPDAMLVAKGYGESNPVASNDTEHGRFRNRRIEYTVVARPA